MILSELTFSDSVMRGHTTPLARPSCPAGPYYTGKRRPAEATASLRQARTGEVLDTCVRLMYLRGMMPVKRRTARAAGLVLFLGGYLLSHATGCSLQGAAVSGAAGAFSGEKAAEVYTSDDDPELVRDAFPFALKTYELLIAQDKSNRSLYLAASSGFVQYASAFLQEEAAVLEDTDFSRSRELRERAARLYLRGCEYSLSGLELKYPEFRDNLRLNPEAVLAHVDDWDVPLLFWAGAGWFGAIANDPSNMKRVVEISLAEAVMRRALELDEDYGDGAIQEFFIIFEGSRSEAMGGSTERAREHYRRALEISAGKKASPHVALASTVAVREQDIEAFRELLGKALAVDLDAEKKWRLSNVLAQRKAKWLLGRLPDLFVEYRGEEE